MVVVAINTIFELSSLSIPKPASAKGAQRSKKHEY
jgi:hypothetical protein